MTRGHLLPGQRVQIVVRAAGARAAAGPIRRRGSRVGIAIVRDLIMRGAGPQLALAVNAIDRPASPHVAQVTLDWVDRLASSDSWHRFRTIDPADWTRLFPADLARARTSLEAYRARRVFITVASRLSTHFAVRQRARRRPPLGADSHQRGQMWATDALVAP